MEPSPQPPSSPPRRRSYAQVADANVSLYQMLHLEAQAGLEQLEEGLRMAQRWWNAQQANPKYRSKASGALARLREARELLLDPIRRQEYDRQLQHFTHTQRSRRWQPVQELMDVMFQERDTCTHEQHLLLFHFGQKRGLEDEEINGLLSEEFLKRGLQVLAPPTPPSSKALQKRGELSPSYKMILTLMGLSLLGILALPFYRLSRPSALLALPFFNNVRLLVRALIPTPERLPTSINGWDWLVGIAVLGGATVTALVELQHTAFFLLGWSIALLIWISWLWIASLARKNSPHLTGSDIDGYYPGESSISPDKWKQNED